MGCYRVCQLTPAHAEFVQYINRNTGKCLFRFLAIAVITA